MLWEAFVVSDVAPRLHDPAECPFDLPAAGQDDESLQQNTAERRRSTPTVHPRPQTGHSTWSPRCIACTRRRARSNVRQRRDLHLPEQNTAAGDLADVNNTPHSWQYLRSTPSDAIGLSIQIASLLSQRSQTLTQLVL
ncbi:hypothetical protein [Streptomyces sp. cmx-18-6]|uniref:hypothetical protein n=1 Tax=Streptomyces sp. cmx-18-6 TaxID=2790930 RepID=UPI00397FAAB0